MRRVVMLINILHGTTAEIWPELVSFGHHAGRYRVSRGTRNRTKRLLCGTPGCLCSDAFGSRGRAPGMPALRFVEEVRNGDTIVELVDMDGPLGAEE